MGDNAKGNDFCNIQTYCKLLDRIVKKMLPKIQAKGENSHPNPPPVKDSFSRFPDL